ncbi:PEP-CTERM sorting domain-containing protein [Tabrizicola sp. J26]|uniref:PEP-CTERM sorting domain-containing protein n=1 Tax=Alitabrizicola rongguiensis TaxID=2909234 RepID=UPI001F16701B|nr:PEP-CTERM sorting domain-containing protein [Tabrizicola rongguiensis]MCF1708706.1 PEP-CTERM sorting domain-containing protein [Tabrizicola rongguiensis]
MRFFAILAAAFLGGQAEAATLVTGTATEVPCGPDYETYDGNAYCLSNGEYLWSNSMSYPDGFTYVHDDSGAFTTFLTRKDGRAFTITSAELWFQNYIWRSSDDAQPPNDDEGIALKTWAMASKPYEVTLKVLGYDDWGDLTALDEVSSKGGIVNYTFGSDFRDVNLVVFMLDMPLFDHYFDFYDALEPGQEWCGDWCGGVIVWSLEGEGPAQVPLPASLPLLAGALCLGFALRRRDLL